MNCPVCDKEILWKDEKYLRCPCGQWLIAAAEDEANTIYGDWSDEELAQLEVGIEFYCDKDLSFFKGKRIITAWHSTMEPGDIVVARSLEELINVLK